MTLGMKCLKYVHAFFKSLVAFGGKVIIMIKFNVVKIT